MEAGSVMADWVAVAEGQVAAGGADLVEEGLVAEEALVAVSSVVVVGEAALVEERLGEVQGEAALEEEGWVAVFVT